MTYEGWVATIEMIAVVSILSLEALSLWDQLRNSKLQRGYWQERKDFYARRLLQPPKVKPPETKEPPKPPEAS